MIHSFTTTSPKRVTLSPRHLVTLSLPQRLIWLTLLLSVLIAWLPLEYSLALFAAIILIIASVWEPVIGLGLAVILGPAKAIIAIARPDLPSDVGQIFFALALAGWLARGLARREIIIPRIWLLLPLGVYIAVSLFSLLPALSLEEGLKEILKWIEIALVIVILVSEAEHRGRLNWIIAGILIAGLAQAFIGIWQFAFAKTGPETFQILGTHYRAYGSFEQPNPYGGFLGLIWPICAGLGIGILKERLKAQGSRPKASTFHPPLSTPSLRPSSFVLRLSSVIGPPSSVFFILSAIYFSFSRGAWLGAAAAALVMLMALPRRWSFGIGLVVLALVVGLGLIRAGLVPASIAARLADTADFTTVTDVRGLNISDSNFAIIERLAHWQAAEAMAQAHPWLGVGIGNYAAAYPNFSLLNWPNALGHAHMIYLNVLAETGVIGLAAYLILWGAIIALTIRLLGQLSGWQRGLALGLLGAWAHLSAHQIVDNLYVNNIHFLIAALLALLVYLSRVVITQPGKDLCHELHELSRIELKKFE
jgi:putative inorganic carbon (HCO3(-)) transporter